MSVFLKDLSLTLQQNRDRLEEAQDHWQQSNQTVPVQFSMGEMVLVKIHPKSSKIQGIMAKLSPRMDGIYMISKVLGPTTYQVWDPSHLMCLGTYLANGLSHFKHPGER